MVKDYILHEKLTTTHLKWYLDDDKSYYVSCAFMNTDYYRSHCTKIIKEHAEQEDLDILDNKYSI